MQVKRFSEIKGYDAPNHRACSTLRVFGAEAGGSKSLIVGISHFLPGGGAGPDASPPEKVYFVLEGELTVIVDGKETVLKRHDSCFIGPNENREIINRGNEVCSILVAIAPAPARSEITSPAGGRGRIAKQSG
jgi:quercetin dioxygenase-like cupin family protein